MKKFISICLSFLMLSILSASTLASEASFPIETNAPSVYLSASDKQIFAAKMDKLYTENILEKNAEAPTREIIDALLLQIPNASSSERDRINEELASYGVFEFKCPVITRPATRTGTGDVTLEVPLIYYEAWSNCWSVTCGGKWNNRNYGDSFGNVGGADGFGVGYTQMKYPYKSRVVSASAFMADVDSKHTVGTSNRSDGDGSKGFGFRLQDKWYGIGDNYIGQHWSGLCTYDSWFGQYNGIATAYYIHTYDSAKLNGVTFGVEGRTAGISASIEFAEDSFTAFSNDKAFGVYP